MLIIAFSVIAGLLFILVLLIMRTQFHQKDIEELVDYYKNLCETHRRDNLYLHSKLMQINESIIKTNTHIVNLISILQESNDKSSDKDKFINYVITSIGDISKDTAAISKNLYFAKGNISVLCDKLHIKKLGKDRYFGKESIPPIKLNLVKGSDNDIDDNTDSNVDDAAVDNMG